MHDVSLLVCIKNWNDEEIFFDLNQCDVLFTLSVYTVYSVASLCYWFPNWGMGPPKRSQENSDYSMKGSFNKWEREKNPLHEMMFTFYIFAFLL